jgi:predicted Zn-dependent protease
MRRLVIAVLSVGVMTACASVSTEQEVALGTDYARQINAQIPLIDDLQLVGYINRLGDSVAVLADDRSLDWHFYIVDSPEVNAFAVPGGYIYINRGLVERAQTMAQVAGVLGHEVGHVTERHSIEQMEKAQQANLGIGLGCILIPSVCQSQAGSAAVQIGAGALFAKFSRDDELEADRVGVRNMVRAGINPEGIPQMFEILLRERERSPASVDAWFSTHPTEEARIQEARAIINEYDSLILRGLTDDTPAFQQFKQRLKSMPPSPRPVRPPTR